MPKFDITLEAGDFIAFLKDLPKQFTDQVLGDMAGKAASVVRREARRNMPIDGELGLMGKKAVIIGKNKANKTERVVTIGSNYVTLKGQPVSIGKIIRHMSAGNQNLRRTKRGRLRGMVKIRGGDFILRAFMTRRLEAQGVMEKEFEKIFRKRASRVRGLDYGR